MYSVKIRDHIMIAHSLFHPGFGKASQLHGATYVIDVQFSSEYLNEMNVVIDIALAADILKEIVEKLNYKNLDEVEDLKGQITTTEFMARYIHDQIARHPRLSFNGMLKVTLGESHIAWASYEHTLD
ncbi:MAG: 6-carboxytetrahydropterin synthase [Saprospiraceae bacterium]|jgi:6-pyruvoyl-tetrahydropterin synthase|nr:6-carboxytetrahydropterin synthase [Saprospiraceae bacterium]MBK6476986.1 6-carboxytetrahydropterin synthase [Saprospiraceae bacterium]MBK6814715.1 6-carboxytetrahydropterin synthase [Saprospiraceae bacterium]MBK7370106.1 6-carboxytetrahydropterin synthase [Saprospiraceae bacterium]MBK7437809.1 6-carboxytetrahydropterin synthase [Saprospiraceae bacterium]